MYFIVNSESGPSQDKISGGGCDDRHRVLCRELLAEREEGDSAGLAEDPPFLIRVLHVRPAPHTSFLTQSSQRPRRAWGGIFIVGALF